MSTAEFLSALRTRDVECWVEGDRLRLRAPEGVVTPEVHAELTRRKGEILAYLRDAASGPAPSSGLTRADRGAPLPLSFDQERLWFLQRLDPESAAYNLQANLPLAGPLDRGALERALTEACRRHEILRTRFPEIEGRPVQEVGAPEAAALAVTEGIVSTDEARRLATADVQTPFDLAARPPLRFRLVATAPERHDLIVTQHHILTDGWSIALLLEEIARLYRSFAGGAPPSLAEPAFHYADFAAWQRRALDGAALEARVAYWREHLSGAPPALELPTDRPRPAAQTFRGAAFDVVLPAELARRVQEAAGAASATPFMVFCAAYAWVLARHAGQEDLVVGTANGRRPLVETETMLGTFVNTLPLRVDASGEPTGRELLRRVRRSAVDGFAHGDLPFEKLVEALQPPRDLSRGPIVQALFVLQNTPLAALVHESAEAPAVLGARNTSGHELSLTLLDTGRGVRATFEYNTDLFDEATVRRLAERYRTALDAIVERPDEPLSSSAGLAEPERRQVLVDWNETRRPVPAVAVQDLVAAQAASHPEAVAVVGPDATLTYAELERRARRLARTLRGAGAGRGSLVGLYLDRGADMVVALLGILKAGAAYVPLDPAFPRERLAWMLEDAAPAAVVTSVARRDELPPHGGSVVAIESALEGDDGPIAAEVGDEDLAYVLFTSGSTGRPKGVAIPHRALTNLLLSMAETPGFAREDVLVAVTTLSFDIAALEIFLPLVRGGRVVVASREAAGDPAALSELLKSSGATVAQATPATWRMLVDAGWPGEPRLKVLCGGEGLPADLAAALGSRCRELWNVYGPTETTIWSTLDRVRGGDVSIGRSLANTRAYVLDSGLRPVGIGAVGELYLGGHGVAHGYRGRPDLTAERFLPDPHGDAGARMYRTGDLARFRNDGRLECLGRVDHQVKIRGFRIELGEIEAALRAQPGVGDCVVVAREDHGSRALVAYVVAGASPLPDLRQALHGRLPDYMVPAAVVTLPTLPRTPNGKIDRKALPAPVFEARAAARVAPRDPVEEAIASVWREVLGLDAVGVHESFFDLGGHSLTAMQVLARVRETFGVAVPVRRLFEAPTIAGLAAAVATERAAGRPALAPLVREPRGGEIPLTFAQERLWFLHYFDDASAAYHLPGAVRLRGALDEAALERALAELVRRHESLRTRFEESDGRPVQRVDPPGAFVLERRDVSALPVDAREAEAQRVCLEVARRPFDLSRGPVFRAACVGLSPDDHVVAVVLHHIVADGWSLGLLVSELSALYDAFARGEASPLAEPAWQYADVAGWQRRLLSGAELERQLGYWKARLAGVTPLALPTDLPRPAEQTFRGAAHVFGLSPERATAVRAFARRERATTFMVLLAAFQSLLSRTSGQDDVTVGTPIAGRARADLESVVGLFANTLVLRGDLSGDPGFREIVGRVRESALDAYAHQEMPFEKLVAELRPERNLSVPPLFQVMFSLQQVAGGAPALSGLRLAPFGIDTTTARLDLTWFVTETPDGFGIAVEYNVDLFDAATIARMAAHFDVLLAAGLREPETRLAALPLLPEAERDQILEGWNRTAGPVGAEAVHQRIAAQALRTPEAPAVGFEGETLTYRELVARARRLASRLRGLGVTTETVVGIAVERSIDMVVAVLGVLEAGGAYLPLDPAFPPERLALMLEDSKAAVLLTERPVAESLPPSGATRVLLDVERDALSREPEWTSPETVDGERAAYLIYTSGSTGRPKGVVVPHRALANFLETMAREPGIAASDVLLSVTTLSFDIAGLELFLPLTVGARVELVRRETAADGARLAGSLGRSGATLLQATPATWRLLVEAGWKGDGVTILCGGEALTGDLAEALLARGRVFNLYGPTETTIWSAVHAVKTAEPVTPLGRPIANTRLYVLDRHLEPVPAGVAGELCIGGLGVARGYHERPDLTAERFVPDPHAATPGARLYRTGDVARFRADGVLEFLGRRDHQVKVRGFRIELGEIEAALASLPSVEAAALVPRDDGPAGTRLIAYVVFDGRDAPTISEMRRALKSRLPAYMVPASFVVLDRLPLTPNGKVDRRALLALDRPQEEVRGRVEPRTETERLIAGLWSDALGTVPVGVHDNFFDIGGHSLLSMRVLARLEAALGLRLNPREMIFQTLEQIAALCDQRLAQLGRVPAEAR